MKARDLLEATPSVVTLKDEEGYEYRFVAHGPREKRRAKRLFTKEPGTIAWLARELRPDDVFYDIGANIGAYTIYAGKRWTGAGSVIAFEPHIPSAASLLENVLLNKLQGKVRLVTTALSDKDGFDLFNYRDTDAASSGSQFGGVVSEDGPFDPVFTEIKGGCTLDSLCGNSRLPPPDLIKLDVDGNELQILHGMERVLRGDRRPRSIQIELHVGSRDAIMRCCLDAGYILQAKHWSESGQRMIDDGHDPERCIYSAIFASPG